MSDTFERASRLRRGDIIRVVAPSGAFDPADFERGLALLGERYELRYEESIYSRAGYLAGDDARRAEEFLKALYDPEAKAILAARGGYGAMRILRALPLSLIRSARKLFIGCSDLTAIHARFYRAGLVTIHGPMLTRIGALGEAHARPLIEMIEGGDRLSFKAKQASGGSAEGRIFGGNLTLIAALVGTGELPDLRGAILALEEINERPYRVDRLLAQLSLAGIFDEIAGVVFGDFLGAEPGPDGATVDEVIDDLLRRHPLPALRGLAFGHGAVNLPLPLGARGRIDGEHLTIVEDAVCGGRESASR